MATQDGKNLNPVIKKVDQFSHDNRQQMEKRISDELNSDVEDEIDELESKYPHAA